MKSKLVFGLLVVMIALALAPSSFAQINIQIFNSASPQEIKTNRTAETSDPTSAGSGITISGSLIASSALTQTDLLLTFPAPISVSPNPPFDVPKGDGIRIVAATGVFASAAIKTVVGSTITLQLIAANVGSGTGNPDNTISGSFRIISTRIDANSLAGAGPFNATASLSNSANNFLLSVTSFPVIGTLGDGITTVAQSACSSASRCGTNPGPIVLFTNKNVAQGSTFLTITEGFNFAWRTESQNERNVTAGLNALGVGPTKIRVTVSGIPSNTTLTVGAINTNSSSVSGVFAVTGGGTSSPQTLTASNNTVVVAITGDRTDSIDQIQLNIATSAPTSNPALGAITATATLWPIGTTFAADTATSVDARVGGVLKTVVDETGATSDLVVPRFAAAEVGPATIGNVVAATTTLLMPLAEKVGPFDTGIGIANTTADPFGSNGGGATATAGTLTLDFFPRSATGAGTAFSLTTSSTVRPGAGLSADGTLAAGGSWLVLLSELLSSAGQTGDFVGYIFIRTNFLLAHGTATISDFKTYSLSANIYVLPNPTGTSRNTLGLESLSQ